MKYILLMITLMFPVAGTAHEWKGKETWTIQLLQDLNEVSRCYNYIYEEKTQAYKQSCWPKMMVEDHNRMLADLAAERAHHPDMEIEQFFYDHHKPEHAEKILIHWYNSQGIKPTMVFIFISDVIIRGPL